MDLDNASQQDTITGIPLDHTAPEAIGVAQMTLEGLLPTTVVLSILYLFFALARRSLMETLYRVGRALSQMLDVGEVLDLAEIEVDQVPLGKVFRHLVMSAIKYTPNGGQVLISSVTSGSSISSTMSGRWAWIGPRHRQGDCHSAPGRCVG